MYVSTEPLADDVSVVDNLYSKEHRYVFELIQNAEDNLYNIATANNETPFLDFKVHHDKIVVESNEDGFLEEHIRAICSIGASTKSNNADYIGEKGIGFKAVFKVAKKVHIQSGPFSFKFVHDRQDDDDGLGMITPHHEDPEVLPAAVRTRMTLTLIDTSNFDKLASEFRAVPDTFLMFLSKLQRLSISLYPPDGSSTVTVHSKRKDETNGVCTTYLTKHITSSKNSASISEQKYYTIQKNLHHLPPDEARKTHKGEDIDFATVTLAFPVDEHDEPIVEQQYTYAFLPLRKVGFTFLIQSDFVTKADREDVVHSKRNEAVLKGVAEAFVDAMVTFCRRPPLRYQWMRYLPSESITDDFWKSLWPLVCDKLKETPLVESWSAQGLYKPSKLQRLAPMFLTDEGNPLLPDLEGSEIYLSPKYSEGDFQILIRLGTSKLHYGSFFDRLEADIRKAQGSIWKTMKSEGRWRTRICELLRRFLKISEPTSSIQKRLKAMSLIPLNDGRWVSNESDVKVCFPSLNDIPIPVDLDLKLAHPSAVDNAAWSAFLSSLGVVNCSSQHVISLINNKYAATNFAQFNLSYAVAHIRYLFWFLPEEAKLAPQVRLANQHGSLLRQDQYLYFPDEEDNYSPSRLFARRDELPGLPVNYLHEEYLKAVNHGVNRNGYPWRRWLEEMAGVHRLPVLKAKDSAKLSKEFRYIIDHRSDELLEVMKRGQVQYTLNSSEDPGKEIVSSQVVLENGSKAALSDSFLPLPKLKRIASELDIADDFPFIYMAEPLQDEQILEWNFLKALHIEYEENLYFYLTALKTISTTWYCEGDQFAELGRVYQNIQSRCVEDMYYVRYVYIAFFPSRN